MVKNIFFKIKIGISFILEPKLSLIFQSHIHIEYNFYFIMFQLDFVEKV